jgi:hypothetical protein
MSSKIGHKVDDQVEAYRIEDFVWEISDHRRQCLGRRMIAKMYQYVRMKMLQCDLQSVSRLLLHNRSLSV